MLDDLRGLLDGITAAGGWFAGSASALAFLAFLVEFVRGRATSTSFRALIGWTVVLLGVFATAAAAHALSARRSPPWSGENWLLTSILVVGVLTVVTGVRAAAFAPSVNRRQLRQLAAVVETSVRRSDFASSLYVPLRFWRRTGAAWLGESREISLRRLDARKLPTASVVVMTGPANSGKSVELEHLVVKMCTHARQRSQPRELAIHVSAHRLPAIEGAIVVDTIRDHLLGSVAQENAALRTVVEEYLESNAGPRWLFVFDLGAEWTREQEEQYFEALRNFMLHRDRDRAIVAVREEFPDASVVLTPQPPDLRVINSLLQRQGLSTKVKPPLAAGKLAPAFADPAMITRFGPQLVDADQKSVRDIIESFLSEQLGRHNAIGTSIQSPRERTEEVAYRIVFGARDAAVSNEEAAPLVAANLVGVEHGTFAFRFPIVGIHLAARHLTRAYQVIPLITVLRSETSRAVLVTALRYGDRRFSQHIVQQIESLIRQVVQLPDDNRSATTLPPLGSFRWSPMALQALTVLRDLDRLGTVTELSPTHHALIDHLLWHAVLGGGRHDREVALTMLALATPRCVLDLYRQAVSLGYDSRTTSIIAISVRFAPLRHPLPTVKERCYMVGRALDTWQTEPLPLRNSPADGYGLLRPLLDKVIFATMMFCFAGAILFALSAIAASSPGIAAGAIIPASLLGFVASRLRSGAALAGSRKSYLPILAVTATLICCSVFSIVYLPIFAASVARLNFVGAVADALFFLFWSWPVFAGVTALRHPLASRSWWFPHKVVAELFHNRAEIRRHAAAFATRFDHLKSLWRRTALCLVAVLLASLSIDLPLRNDIERRIDIIATAVLLLAVLAIVFRRPSRASKTPIDIVGRQILDCSMTEDGLLAEFADRANRGYRQFSQLIKVLAATRPGALRDCVHVLQALDEILEYFERTLPAPAVRSNVRIKPDMWRYAPVSHPAELREWAVATDRKRPGLLLRLANSEVDRKMLARAIENSTNQIVPEVLSPPAESGAEGGTLVGQLGDGDTPA